MLSCCSEVWPLYENSLDWSSGSWWNKREGRRGWGGRGMSERDGRKRAAGRKRGSREGGVIPVFSYVVPQSRRVAVRGEEKTKKKQRSPQT